jgi:acetolactate decarboxylase
MASKIFQHGSFTTLYGGFYEGTITLEEALKHGSIGIGTLDGAHGEVTILDGVAYQGDEHNHVRQVGLHETLPYVATGEHEAFATFELEKISDDALTGLSEHFPTVNCAYTVLMTGIFDSIEISSKPPRNEGRDYLDVIGKGPRFVRENVEGTIIGIWSPKHLSGLFGSGFHLHFLSADKMFSAHLQHFSGENIHVELGQIDKIEQEFPVSSDDFKSLKL